MVKAATSRVAVWCSAESRLDEIKQAKKEEEEEGEDRRGLLASQ